MDNRLASLRRILRIHINWLTVKLLGTELVSKEELAELKDYGRLDLGDEVGLIESSFVLGRISALSKKSEYKDITLEKLSLLKKRKFSSIEKLAIREAKLHASRRLQTLSEDAAAGAFARVNKATQDLLADATAKDIIQEELALAIAEKKTRKELAASVGNKLGADLTAGFRKLIVTEMHRAKTRGIAMAISNKVDIYSSSEGAQSIVSVVPNRGACKDCENLYLSETGDPKTFKLSDLVGQGTNADPGISHARTHGLHLGWRPVMPPAHPNCFCELVYVPAGMGWKNGKLVVVDEFKYKEQISKAVDKSTMSATIKPHGAPSNQAEKKASPPSIPGIAAPGNGQESGGRPPGSGDLTKPAGLDVSAHTRATPESAAGGPDIEYEYWGARGGSPPQGEGWEKSPKSQAWRRPLGMGGEGSAEEQVDPKVAAQEQLATMMAIGDYKHEEHTADVAEGHIKNGEVVNSKSLKKNEFKGKQAGINDSYKDDIKDNGSMLKKPGESSFGSEIQREVGAYKGHVLAGSDRCPPTFVRTRDKVPASGQVWLGDHTNAFTACEEIFDHELKELAGTGVQALARPGRLVKAILSVAPDTDVAVEQLSTIAVMDMVQNNTDRHIENFMISEDFSDIRAIDHGYCFEPGIMSYKCKIHEGFHATGRNMKIPAKMRTRMENTSYGDMDKAYGDHLQEWQTAQTYLRQKYVMHIADENDGNLPYDAFQGMPERDRSIGNDRFEDFMVDWIDTHSSNPDSPEHETAKYFDQIGVFVDPSNVRQTSVAMNVEISIGANYTYEQEVRSNKAAGEAYRNPGAQWVLDAKNKQDEMIEAINASQIEELRTKLNAAADEYMDLKSKIVDFRENNEHPNDEYWAMMAAVQPLGRRHRELKEEYNNLHTSTKNQQSRERRMFNIVPEGFREKFDELAAKAEAAKASRRDGKRGGNAYRREPGIKVKSPADIEREKRNA